MASRYAAACILLAVIILMPAWFFLAVAETPPFEYDAHGRRDPFVPLVNSEGEILTFSRDIKTVTDIALEGIMYDQSGGSYAVLNGEVLQVGDKFEIYEIKEINRGQVILTFDGKDITLSLDEKEGE